LQFFKIKFSDDNKKVVHLISYLQNIIQHIMGLKLKLLALLFIIIGLVAISCTKNSKSNNSGTEEWTTYTTKQGLSSNEIFALAIDKQGALWIGTEYGITKYDGNTFQKFQQSSSGLIYHSVHSIAVDSDNNKWFGTSEGVSKFDGTTWLSYTTDFGLVDNYINSIAVDGYGNIWFATPEGVSRFDGLNWKIFVNKAIQY